MVRVSRSPQADPLPGGELAAFVAAVESGSVQGAADALELTQSATTKRIQSLERRLGQPLLNRGRHGTVPADLGRALYPLAKRALQALADVSEAADAAGTAAKTLRLSASLTLGEFLVPGWLGAFRAQRPDVRPQLEVINSSQVTRHVADGDAEIGFVEGHDDLSGFETLTVAHDELVVVVSAAHRWARRRWVRARDLPTEPYLTRERLSGTRTVADDALQRVGIALEPALEAASLQSLKRAIATGGFTVISALAVEAEQRAGSLVGLPVRDADMRRCLRAIRRPHAHQTEPAKALWTWLGSHAGA
jgi:DNA-binding transcriptional LysR family regulator